MVKLDALRVIYARQILALANAEGDQRLQDAFSAVAREYFLGDEPWLILPPHSRYVRLQHNDPALIYQDVLVGLSPDRCINNGSPALHARLLHAMKPQEGEIIAHLGAGTGYYSAILATLVGSRGRVIAVENDDRLAQAARKNLRNFHNVEVISGDGSDQPAQDVNCIYVNFAVPGPSHQWLRRLAAGGRLVFPLGVPGAYAFADGGRHAIDGVALLITRNGTEFDAASLGTVSFVYADGRLGAGTGELNRLSESLVRGDADTIRSLHWGQSGIKDAWFQGKDWALCR